MFTLTQNTPLPPSDMWESTPAQFPTDEVYTVFLRDLREIQDKFRLRNPLCPENFRGNKYSTELLNKIVDYSRMQIRTLLSDSEESSVSTVSTVSTVNTVNTVSTGVGSGVSTGVNTVGTRANHTALYYTYIELYRKVFTTSFINRIRTRYEEIKNKAVGRRKAHLEEVGVKIKGVPLRSFHILDNSADTTKAFRIIINYIESETGSSIAWNHLSTYSLARDTYDRIEHVKDATHWTKGVDGNGCNIANIRAWKNKVTTILKNVDTIVINDVGMYTGCVDSTVGTDITDLKDRADLDSEQNDLTAGALAFVLMNLNPSGTAIISLQIASLAHASTVSMIHLFSLCFEDARIIHTEAEDRLFLCGTEFKGNIISRQYSHLIAACQTKNSIFATEYMNGPEFTTTVEKLLNVIRAASEWRLRQYQKMFTIYEKLSTSLSSRMVRGHDERILEEYYPDESKYWSKSVGL
jgi:hypothetical protein